MNINLHIERLMLDGLSIASGEAALVQMAVEAELGRLLATELFARPESNMHTRFPRCGHVLRNARTTPSSPRTTTTASAHI